MILSTLYAWGMRRGRLAPRHRRHGNRRPCHPEQRQYGEAAMIKTLSAAIGPGSVAKRRAARYSA